MWNMTTFTDVQSFMQFPNQLTGGWFWAMMLFSIGIVIFIIARQKTSSDRAFATAGVGSWVFGSFLFFLGWIPWLVYAATILLLIGGIISTMLRQNPET